MCLKHQFLSKYSIIFSKVAGCFVPRGVDRLDAEFVGALLRIATSASFPALAYRSDRRQSTDITLQKGSSQRRRLPDRWKHAITISPMSSAATPKKEAKVHHSRHICLLGFAGFKNRAAREIRTQFARAIKLFRTTLRNGKRAACDY